MELASFAAVLEYTSLIWALCNLGYGILRGQAQRAAVYGAALAIGAVIALNMGGVVNASSWHVFTLIIFAAEALFNLWRGPKWKVAVFGLLFFMSVVTGV